ncbi:MAG TPA: tetratricopeptide repeat protein [Cyclobacteriaceae bacterium]|nr:tetratricopeptide repeat protein [Cyclobacteriaceae bacterium]
MAKKQEKKGGDILENPDALAEQLSRTETFIEQNPKLILGVASAIALVIAAYFGFKYYIDNQNERAQSEMFQAVYYFEADSLDFALNGDGNFLGFLDIINDYKMTEAANLANYYAGVSYMKKGNYRLAILYLEDFSSKDLLVQARAYSLIGDAYMEQQEYDNAVKYYNKAANYKPNKHFTPGYLMKVALAYEKLDQRAKAIEAYDRIITDYWDSSEVQSAKKYKARLQDIKS